MTRPDLEKRGLGTALMRKVQERVDENGCGVQLGTREKSNVSLFCPLHLALALGLMLIEVWTFQIQFNMRWGFEVVYEDTCALINGEDNTLWHLRRLPK